MAEKVYNIDILLRIPICSLSPQSNLQLQHKKHALTNNLFES